MEMSTVFPPPTSPTEDPCETDVTNVAIHSVTLLICLCGLFGNGAVLCLLSLELTNRRTFGLAVVDFLFLLFMMPCALLFLVEDVSCSPIMPLGFLSFVFQLSVFSQYWMLYCLIDFGIVTAIAKLCELLCHCRLPKRLLWVLWDIEYWAFFVLITIIPTVSFLCPSHEQQQCRAALISIFTVILLLRAAPTIISRTIKFIKAKCGSQQQKLKRRDIAIFLIVLVSLILTLWNFLDQLGYTPVSSQIFLLLTCINSSIKPLIYFLLGRCWRPCSVGSLRESLQRVFDEQNDSTAPRNDAKTDTGDQRLMILDTEQLIHETAQRIRDTAQLICDNTQPVRDTAQLIRDTVHLTRCTAHLTRNTLLLRNPETVADSFSESPNQ